MAGAPLRHSVFQYMANKSGVPVGIKEIMEALGLQDGQVRAAMRNLMNHETSGQFISVVVPGQLWVYAQPAVITKPVVAQVAQTVNAQPITSTVDQVGQPATRRAREAAKAAESTLFEKVGELAGGELLLRDTHGIIWKASQL